MKKQQPTFEAKVTVWPASFDHSKQTQVWYNKEARQWEVVEPHIVWGKHITLHPVIGQGVC